MNQVGASTVFQLKHFRRFLESELHKALPYEFSGGPAEYRAGFYATFLDQQIHSIGNRAEQAKQKQHRRKEKLMGTNIEMLQLRPSF
jgi:hypothetical protein